MAKHSVFKGFDIIKNDDGSFSVMAPYRNHLGTKGHRAEGKFSTHMKMRDYVHENCMEWMEI